MAATIKEPKMHRYATTIFSNLHDTKNIHKNILFGMLVIMKQMNKYGEDKYGKIHVWIGTKKRGKK